MTDPLILFRAVHIAATVLASGTVAFIVLVAEPALATAFGRHFVLRHRLGWVTWIALALAILSEAGWLGAALRRKSMARRSSPRACTAASGRCSPIPVSVWCTTVRLALALLLGLLIPWPATRLLQLAAAARSIALIALNRPCRAANARNCRRDPSRVRHCDISLASAGAWLGGLPALAMLLARARHTDDAAWQRFAVGATRRFSWLGVVCVGACTGQRHRQ